MPNLDTADFSTVWNDDFANDSSLNRSLWPQIWGKSDDFSFGHGMLTIKSDASEGWSNTGFMQNDSSKSSGDGYGLYSVTASLDAGQGAGACVDLWPANNSWPGAELDLMETWGSTRSQAFATIHWAGSGNSNAYTSHQFSVNLEQKNTFSMDWEKGSITYYVNGTEIFQTTSHVPVDAAGGGINESMGAQVSNAKNGAVSSTVALNIYDMSYAAPKSSAIKSVASATSQDTVGSTISATAASANVPASPTFLSASHTTTRLASGETLNDTGTSNRLVFPAAGTVTLNAGVLGNSDSFDLRAVMAKTDWDGKTADLSRYLSAKSSGGNLDVLLHPAGGASSTVLAVITGAGKDSLASFEQHAIF